MDEMISIPRELLEELLDGGACEYDHHGGCQAHGHLSLKKGERCPQEVARELLTTNKQKEKGHA